MTKLNTKCDGENNVVLFSIVNIERQSEHYDYASSKH